MRKSFDTIAVLDFGGQYAHLIANRIRRLGVYSEIHPNNVDPALLRNCRGIVLSGGPSSVTDENAPPMQPGVLQLDIPVLGLCYGHQLMAKILGGTVTRGEHREYGLAAMRIVADDPLFAGLEETQQIWMSHGDSVEDPPEGFAVLGSTPDCRVTAMGHAGKKLYGLQFHPEVTDTPNGMRVLGNFIDICGCCRSWNAETFKEEMKRDIEARCNGRRVFLLVSGGVDSTVAFTFLNAILGSDKVMGLHIDNGLMRKEESTEVICYLREHGFDNLQIEDASREFLSALAGIVDPERKRTIIGNMFLTVQEQAQKKFGLNADEWILGQGTIYPDTIESAGTQHSDKIKTHHNRVDLVLELIEKGLVVEPLAQLYKDEVRQLGEQLGLPHRLIWRHPFPGPGLGVRVLCSDGKTAAISEADERQVGALAAADGFSASILPIRSVGVQGDSRTYAHPALVSGPRNWKALEALSTKITNRIRGVNRVVFALSPVCGSYRLIKADLSPERLNKLREIDHLVTEALHASGEYDTIWQMPVVLLPLVNGRGDECVVLRPVKSQEAMTARFYPLADTTLSTIIEGARKIKGVGDVFFDITHKPPATIEWE
jgi:GMP synthase (glutamine-hydrolysing)